VSETDLQEADSVQITVLVDNYIDMFVVSASATDRRPFLPPPAALLAEHGLACLIEVTSGMKKHSILMDTGISKSSLFHNARLLGCDLAGVEALVLSHGHFDHIGGVLEFYRQIGKSIPLVLHPDCFLTRRLNRPGKEPIALPMLDETSLRDAGAPLHLRKGTSTLADSLLLATGEIERRTSFEKGFPGMEAHVHDRWSADPINDDQALVVKVKGKGLVILSGCAHAGIINTVEHVKRLTRTDHVHAVLGGFHLTGPIFEPLIRPTLDEMKRIKPDVIVPMHCTGWKAIGQFAREMPEAFILNTVGTSYAL